jgi:acyl dehydratase
MSSAENIPVVGLGFHREEMIVGQKFRTLGRTVTESDIINFINATGMLEVLFTNIEHLRHESVYDGRLVPAALVYCFAEGLLMQTVLQTTGMGFLSMELAVQKPTFAGDTIYVECEVTESRATTKADRGIVKTTNRVINQRGEIVLTYSPVRMMKSKAAA